VDYWFGEADSGATDGCLRALRRRPMSSTRPPVLIR
jgi:hypothetical protein